MLIPSHVGKPGKAGFEETKVRHNHPVCKAKKVVNHKLKGSGFSEAVVGLWSVRHYCTSFVVVLVSY